MSHRESGSVVHAVELSEVKHWAPKTDAETHGGERSNGNAGAQDALVPLDLEAAKLGGSGGLEPMNTPRGWKQWLDRALRINKSAGTMTRSRALFLVLLSFFFVLTTSLLVTGFQGLLPALLKDGVRALLDLLDPTPQDEGRKGLSFNSGSGAPSDAAQMRSNHPLPAFHSLYTSAFQRKFAPHSETAVAAYESSWEAKIDMLAEFVDTVQGKETFSRKRMSGGGNSGTGAQCNKQKLRLNLMLTVSVTLLNLVCFPLGIIVDKTGPRWVGLSGSLVMILGSILFAFSNSRTFDAYIPAYTLIGIGGVGIFMSLLHLLNVFPEHRGLLTTLYTATEDASTGVFYFFRRIHSAGVSLRTLFLGYTAVPIVHLVVVAFQPSRVVLNEKTEKCQEFYPVSLQPLRKQALSVQYISVMLWNAAMGVTTYFYLSSLHEQLVWLFGSTALADRGTEIFSFLFMICPFVAVPFTGWIIDAFGTWPSLLFVAAQCLTYGLLASVRVWWLQYITWGTFVVTRASFIGVSAHWVNQMFGENFSTLVGMMWTVGGLANFSNYFWNYIALNLFKSNYLIMNLIMTAISVCSTLAAAFVVYKSLGTRGDHQPLSEALPSSLSDESLDTLTRTDSDDTFTSSSSSHGLDSD